MPAKTKAKTTKKKAPAKKKTAAPKAECLCAKSAGCRVCDELPMGSAELVAVLVVTVCCLTAVLLTAVVSIDMKTAEVQSLNQNVSTLEARL